MAIHMIDTCAMTPFDSVSRQSKGSRHLVTFSRAGRPLAGDNGPYPSLIQPAKVGQPSWRQLMPDTKFFDGAKCFHGRGDAPQNTLDVV
jgi:hypothetical protein